MPRVANTIRLAREASLWVWCAVMVGLESEGWFWVIGRHARERAFIRRLLLEYPGLAEQPNARLNHIADRALGSLARWPGRIATFAAMGIGGLVATAAWSVLFAWGAPLPPWTRPPAVAAGAIVVGEAVRRAYARRDVTRAIVSFYPTLFCPCGYCLLGLPDDVARCPECGARRSTGPVTSPASSPPALASSSVAPPAADG